MYHSTDQNNILSSIFKHKMTLAVKVEFCKNLYEDENIISVRFMVVINNKKILFLCLLTYM